MVHEMDRAFLIKRLRFIYRFLALFSIQFSKINFMFNLRRLCGKMAAKAVESIE